MLREALYRGEFMDDRNVAVWWAIAATSSLWALLALGAGDGAVLPGILGAVALVVDRGRRLRLAS